MVDTKKNELYHLRKANHECPVCGKKLRKTYAFTHCEDCREKLKARQKMLDASKLNAKRRERYEERKERHACPRCGETILENSTEYLCEKCLAYARIINQKMAKKNHRKAELLNRLTKQK
jgi:ribosomal protein S27AE